MAAPQARSLAVSNASFPNLLGLWLPGSSVFEDALTWRRQAPVKVVVIYYPCSGRVLTRIGAVLRDMLSGGKG